MASNLAVPCARQLNVFPSSLLRFLLERVQHVDSLGKFGHIEQAPFSENMDTNLSHIGAHFVQGLPIRRVQPSLNETQLETDYSPSFCRELSEVIKARTDEFQAFHEIKYISLLITLSTNHDGVHVPSFGRLDFKVLLLEKPGGAPQATFTEQKGFRWYSQR